MSGFALLVIAVLGGMFIAAAVLFLFFLKAVFWVILLPFRLLFWLPLFLVKTVLVGIAGVVMTLLFVAGSVVVALAVLVPLVPIVLLLGMTWAIVRLLRRPATT
jgi:hypothetical protein